MKSMDRVSEDLKLSTIKKTMAGLGDTFKTSDVIRKLKGKFISDTGTPAGISGNARIGKFLSKQSSYLNIEPVEKGTKIKDDTGHPTHTAVWKKIILPVLALFLSVISAHSQVSPELLRNWVLEKSKLDINMSLEENISRLKKSGFKELDKFTKKPLGYSFGLGNGFIRDSTADYKGLEIFYHQSPYSSITRITHIPQKDYRCLTSYKEGLLTGITIRISVDTDDFANLWGIISRDLGKLTNNYSFLKYNYRGEYQDSFCSIAARWYYPQNTPWVSTLILDISFEVNKAKVAEIRQEKKKHN